MKSDSLRQAVGKVDIATTQLVYGEWKILEVAPDLPPTSDYGVSHGNGSKPPPKSSSGGSNGFFGWRPSSDEAVIRAFMWYRGSVKDVRLPYIHSINMYIGRSVETGEPWLAPGNSVRVKISRNHWYSNAYIEIKAVQAPMDSEEETQMIGPFNFNFEDVLWQVGTPREMDFLVVSAMLEGPNTDQQEDVFVLGKRSGFWTIESVPPMFYYS